MAKEMIAGLQPTPSSKPDRRNRKGFGFLGSAIVVIVIGGMFVAVLLPSLCKSRETANVTKCASNLFQIGLAISAYAERNGGHYPPSLAVLLKEQKVAPATMVCPSSNDQPASAGDAAGMSAELRAVETNTAGHEHCLSYIYVGAKLTTATVTSATIVAYEPLDNHDGDGTNVLFGDGHAEWVNRRSWPKVAADGGVPVVKSLTTRP